jgi:hypothetical protein
MLTWIFIVLAHWNNSPRIEPTSLCYFFLMLCAQRRSHKYQFYSHWLDPIRTDTNPWTTSPEASTLSITSLMRSVFLCECDIATLSYIVWLCLLSFTYCLILRIVPRTSDRRIEWQTNTSPCLCKTTQMSEMQLLNEAASDSNLQIHFSLTSYLAVCSFHFPTNLGEFWKNGTYHIDSIYILHFLFVFFNKQTLLPQSILSFGHCFSDLRFMDSDYPFGIFKLFAKQRWSPL